MYFADKYLTNNVVFEQLIKSKPHSRTGIIICIPCYNEENVLETIQSLKSCESIICIVEVIIFINESLECDQKVKKHNLNTYKEIKKWISKQKNQTIKFYVLHKTIPHKYKQGVGLARKIIMDEALRRFDYINKPEGIIVSLDADTVCEKNYLTAIENFYRKNPKTIAANIFFEHPIEGNALLKIQYDAIISYELYLRYFVNVLKWCGHPHSYHTIGSALSVRADTYFLQGGMNRRQAGEDFYFLHKIIPLGNFGEINNTTVYPSARISNRVPFGTGKSVENFIKTKELNVYNPKVFNDIKIFISQRNLFFKKSKSFINEYLNTSENALSDYLNQDNFSGKIDEIDENSASIHAFNNRFFRTFNIFYFIKYLNFIHQSIVKKVDIFDAAQALLSAMKLKNERTKKDILIKFRKSDRNDGYQK